MITRNHERDLSLLFDELKAADAQHTPPFTSIEGLDAPVGPSHRPLGRLQWALAAGTVAILAALALGSFRSHEDTATKEEQQWAAFSNWEAATDTLLAMSSARSDGTPPGSSPDAIQLPSNSGSKNL